MDPLRPAVGTWLLLLLVGTGMAAWLEPAADLAHLGVTVALVGWMVEHGVMTRGKPARASAFLALAVVGVALLGAIGRDTAVFAHIAVALLGITSAFLVHLTRRSGRALGDAWDAAWAVLWMAFGTAIVWAVRLLL